jgi:hypothetical protein
MVFEVPSIRNGIRVYKDASSSQSSVLEEGRKTAVISIIHPRRSKKNNSHFDLQKLATANAESFVNLDTASEQVQEDRLSFA